VLCGAVRCGAVRCGAVRCGAVRCGAVRCGAVRCDAMRCDAMRCDAMRCDAQVANKDYEAGVQLAAYDSFYVGFELWIVNNGTIFDNILVTDDLSYAEAQGKKLWLPTSEGEKDVKEKWDKENKPADDMPDEADEDEDEEEPEKDEL
jgi:hypothetical protein